MDHYSSLHWHITDPFCKSVSQYIHMNEHFKDHFTCHSLFSYKVIHVDENRQQVTENEEQRTGNEELGKRENNKCPIFHVWKLDLVMLFFV